MSVVRLVEALVWIAAGLLWPVALVGVVRTGRARRYRGRHISRPLRRRLGFARMVALERTLEVAIVVGLVSLAVGYATVAYPVAFLALQLWAIDDWLFRDDDDRKRRHEWARVRLRMPKPVRLRPAERWSPAPA